MECRIKISDIGGGRKLFTYSPNDGESASVVPGHHGQHCTTTGEPKEMVDEQKKKNTRRQGLKRSNLQGSQIGQLLNVVVDVVVNNLSLGIVTTMDDTMADELDIFPVPQLG